VGRSYNEMVGNSVIATQIAVSSSGTDATTSATTSRSSSSRIGSLIVCC